MGCNAEWIVPRAVARRHARSCASMSMRDLATLAATLRPQVAVLAESLSLLSCAEAEIERRRKRGESPEE